MWRFDPKTKRVEVLNHGTTNPWGHDWDALGEPFFINTVNGHLWHSIPGAHFVRPHTIDPNPRIYRADRPARRPLPLGHRQGLVRLAERHRPSTTAAAAATPTAG